MRKSGKYTIGCIIGTRPEVIKMASIIFELRKQDWVNIIIINTAQHRSLLNDMLKLFNIIPDYDLDIMTANQSLGELTSNLTRQLDVLFNTDSFDVLIAAGDTTTVFISSLMAFYNHIPFAHVEAGLRTYNISEPFPEEINRVLTAPLSTWNFAPTKIEEENLLKSNINLDQIYVTGNPVIDALYWVLNNTSDLKILPNLKNFIIVTIHRRENFGENIKHVCHALVELTQKFNNIHFVIPVHPNPNVQNTILKILHKKRRIHLLEPISYNQFIHLMKRSILILTDSGGIQEEAPALSKPVLVLRNRTERPAVISSGVGLLIGTEKTKIVEAVSELITNKTLYTSMTPGISPYGDGHSAERIVSILIKSLIEKSSKHKPI